MSASNTSSIVKSQSNKRPSKVRRLVARSPFSLAVAAARFLPCLNEAIRGENPMRYSRLDRRLCGSALLREGACLPDMSDFPDNGVTFFRRCALSEADIGHLLSRTAISSKADFGERAQNPYFKQTGSRSAAGVPGQNCTADQVACRAH